MKTHTNIPEKNKHCKEEIRKNAEYSLAVNITSGNNNEEIRKPNARTQKLQQRLEGQETGEHLTRLAAKKIDKAKQRRDTKTDRKEGEARNNHCKERLRRKQQHSP